MLWNPEKRINELTGKVLILGNGISRLAYDSDIRKFSLGTAEEGHGEVWGCNRVYLDYGDIITAIAGHTDVMEEARTARGLREYEVFGLEREWTCRELFRKDTGTTLVAEALTLGLKVICCGFDLGGLDVYSPGHEKKNKSTWIQRWRLILSEFEEEDVSFWGYDHKPFLLSRAPAGTYSEKYTRGKNHIEDEEYQKIRAEWGNDYSRINALVPCAVLINTGDREWHFSEGIVLSGASIIIPKTCAEKYLALYPRDFIMELLPD